MSSTRFLFFCLMIIGLSGCVSTAQNQQQQQQQADVHYKLGVAHLQAQNPTSALKELLIAVEHEPENSSIQVALAQAYQLKKSYQNAERHYLKALEISKNEPRYQNNLASLYLDMEQWDKAADYFDKASGSLFFLKTHVALTGRGYAYYRKGDYAAALAGLKEALALAPLYAPAHFYKSEVYRSLGQTDLSRGSLERAIELAPHYLQARYQLAVLLLKEQQREKAASEFQAIIDLAPDSEWGVKSATLIKALKK